MASPGTSGRRTALCAAAIALLPFALFWRVTIGQLAFDEGDLFDYNYPLLRAIAEQWRAGEVPLWNPYLFGGTPLHANMQGGAFYPPNLLLLVGTDWLAYQHSLLLHLSMAGVFTFFYLRALRLARPAAAFGAVAFMLGGFGIGHLGHVSTLRTVPWLPLILWGFERWRATLDRRYVMLAGMAMGLMLLAGHPQIPLYALVVAGAYLLALVARAPGPGRSRLLLGGALAFLLGAGLAAVQILPTLQLAAEEYLRPDDRSYEYFVNYSLEPRMLANLVFPRLLPGNEAELSVYVGISTLILALLGAWRCPPPQRAERSFFVWLAGAALLLALGKWTPLSPLLFHLPLYNLFTSPARNLFEFGFALAVLAALGVEAMRDPAQRRARRTAVLAFVALAGLGLFLALRGVEWEWPAVSARWPILLASCGLVAFLPEAGRWRSVACVALLALLAGDLFSYGGGIYGLHPPEAAYTSHPPVLHFLNTRVELGRILTLEQPEDDHAQAIALLSPNANVLHRIESLNGFDSMMLRQVDAASAHVMPTYGMILGAPAYNDPQFRRFMDLLNARHVLTPAGRSLVLEAPRYRTVYEDAQVRVFENTQALPRLFLAPRVRVVTHEQALHVLASGELDGRAFDPRQLALVEGAPVHGLDEGGAAEALGSLQLLERRAGDLRVAVESPRPALLVHSANYSRGWTARVDGEPAPVWRVDGLLQGVPVGGGRHEVRLEYRPGSFVLGAAISLTSLVLAAACLKPRPSARSGRDGHRETPARPPEPRRAGARPAVGARRPG